MSPVTAPGTTGWPPLLVSAGQTPVSRKPHPSVQQGDTIRCMAKSMWKIRNGPLEGDEYALKASSNCVEFSLLSFLHSRNRSHRRQRRAIVLSSAMLTSAALVTLGACTEAGSPAEVADMTAAGTHASPGMPPPVGMNPDKGPGGMNGNTTVFVPPPASVRSAAFVGSAASMGSAAFVGSAASMGSAAFVGSAASIESAAFVGSVASIGGNSNAYTFLSTPIARWNPCQVIGYRVNLANSTAGALTDVKGAIARVSSATGLRFVYRGSTKILPGRANDTYPADTGLVIAWATPGQSTMLPKTNNKYQTVAGVGGGYWGSARDTKGKPANMINEGFVVLNGTIKLAGGFGTGPKYGWQGTRGQALMHELGHMAGLDHPSMNDKVQIMYSVLTLKPAVWGAGDKNGLRRVGASAGCLRR